jgi:hypothetical protein
MIGEVMPPNSASQRYCMSALGETLELPLLAGSASWRAGVERPVLRDCSHWRQVERRRDDETRNLVKGRMPSMKVTTGIVVDGKVVVEGESLAEGSTVTVVLRDNEEAFELTPGEEDELLDSIAQIERGEFVSGEQLLERLRRFG